MIFYILYSGHGIIIAWVPCVYQTFYRHKYAGYVIWGAYIQHSLRTTYERWHYSVDMILAGVVMYLFFYLFRNVYDEDKEKLNLDRK